MSRPAPKWPEKWTLRPFEAEPAQELADALDLPPLLGQLLVQRGIRSEEAAREFLDAPLPALRDPFLMKGMEEAASHLAECIASGRPIGVYGDYDVDGISATALMCRFLSHLNPGKVSYYIPSRLDEGYGLHAEGLAKLKAAGCETVVTVDCGVSAHDAAREAQRMGINLIITDHHRVSDEVPPALAILNPRQKDCGYPFKELSGVGVAFKLATAVRRRLHEADPDTALPNLKQHLDLVALGTVADVVPLRDENHIFVRHGLELLSPPAAEGGFEAMDRRKAGVRALQAAANLKAEALNAGHVSFALAPRLNAAGRVGEAAYGVELLLCDDEGDARARAEVLEEWNRQRQTLQQEAWEEATAMLESPGEGPPGDAIVLASDRWHPGVVGIVAAKLVDAYRQPSVLIHLENGVGKGSVRSAMGLHVYEALERCADLLIQFGGHKGAAGVKVEEGKIDAFRARFQEVIRDMKAPGADEGELVLDAAVDFAQMNAPFLEKLEELAPFGEGNPRPGFCSPRVEVVGSPGIVGRDGEHLKMILRQFREDREAIGFGMGFLLKEPGRLEGKLDVAFCPGLNHWRGNTRVQLELRAIRPAAN